jgi:toxin ParE1/3/4
VDYKIKWSPRAFSHLEQICEYIALDSETYARIFVQKILKIIEDIPSFPKSGRIVPEYNDKNLREHIFGNYRIVYRLAEKTVEVVTICHSSQLIHSQFND